MLYKTSFFTLYTHRFCMLLLAVRAKMYYGAEEAMKKRSSQIEKQWNKSCKSLWTV